jgi:hypothetical protein
MGDSVPGSAHSVASIRSVERTTRSKPARAIRPRRDATLRRRQGVRRRAGRRRRAEVRESAVALTPIVPFQLRLADRRGSPRPRLPRCTPSTLSSCYPPGVPSPLPDFIQILFWDVDPATVDLTGHRDYVMERVMTRGGWDAMRWLRSTYETTSLADFLQTRGERLAPRERAYWSLVALCEVPQEQGGGRPPWT